MDIEFENDDLDRLEIDPSFTADRPLDVIRSYRRRMQQIRAAKDKTDLSNLRSLRLEELKGSTNQHSIKLNSQWLLSLEITGEQRCKITGIHKNADHHQLESM